MSVSQRFDLPPSQNALLIIVHRINQDEHDCYWCLSLTQEEARARAVRVFSDSGMKRITLNT